MDGDRLILGSDRTAVSDGSHPAWAILIVHEGLGFGRQVRPTGYKVMPRFASRMNDRSPGSYSRTPACDRRETVCIGAPIRTSLAGAVRQRPGRCAPAPPVAPPQPAPQEAVRSGRGNGRLRSNQVYNPGLHSTDTVRAACIQGLVRGSLGARPCRQALRLGRTAARLRGLTARTAQALGYHAECSGSRTKSAAPHSIRHVQQVKS